WACGEQVNSRAGRALQPAHFPFVVRLYSEEKRLPAILLVGTFRSDAARDPRRPDCCSQGTATADCRTASRGNFRTSPERPSIRGIRIVVESLGLSYRAHGWFQ